ncbi:MAG: hypothetical protein Q4G43_13815 [Mobilicoccus sp.]|nr:hypothetical protein [Mobilicoccus sp.]
MSARTIDRPDPSTTDTPTHRESTHPRVTMLSRTAIELRKLVDTRAAAVLIAAMVGIGLVATGAMLALDLATDLDTLTRTAAAGFTYLLPVLGVLALTAEWRTGTALWTYTLDPHRTRVLTAKMIAVGIAVVVAVAISLVMGAVATFLVDGTLTGGSNPIDVIIGAGVFIGGMTLLGVALGAAFLNTPLAIVVLLLAPQLVPQLLSISERTADLVPYVDLQGHLMTLSAGEAVEWPHLLVTLAVWIVLPLTVGVIRNARRDI